MTERSMDVAFATNAAAAGVGTSDPALVAAGRSGCWSRPRAAWPRRWRMSLAGYWPLRPWQSSRSLCTRKRPRQRRARPGRAGSRLPLALRWAAGCFCVREGRSRRSQPVPNRSGCRGWTRCHRCRPSSSERFCPTTPSLSRPSATLFRLGSPRPGPPSSWWRSSSWASAGVAAPLVLLVFRRKDAPKIYQEWRVWLIANGH